MQHKANARRPLVVSDAALYLSREQLCRRWGMSRATTYRLQSSGQLPAPVRFSRGIARWHLNEIEEIEQRIARDRIGGEVAS